MAAAILAGLLLWCVSPVVEAGFRQGRDPELKVLAKKKPKKKKSTFKKVYARALKSYKNGKYAQALQDFQALHDRKPSPRLRYYVGMCLLGLERWLEAETELEGYLADAGKKADKKKKKAVQEALEQIEAHVGQLQVKTDLDGATLTVDGQPASGWTLRLEEGQYQLVVSSPGQDDVVQVVEVLGGESTKVRMDGPDQFQEADQPPRKDAKKLPVVWFASTAGLAGALALTAVITGSVALSREDDYASMGAGDDWRSYRQTTLKLGLATDVLWGVAAGAAVAAVVLAFFTDFGKKEKKDASVSMTPIIGPFNLALTGVF